MHKPEPYLEAPATDAALWRYMDFTKLLSLLEKEALFLARADRLGDPYEGFLPKQALTRWKEEFQNTGDPKTEIYSNITQVFKTVCRWTLMSCWHESANESAAMWKCYNSSPDGIAIKTSYRRLCESLIGPEEIYIGRVSYIDYDSPEPVGIFDVQDGLGNETPVDHPLKLRSQFFKKRKEFQHEHEVRALHAKPLHGLFAGGMTRELPEPEWESGVYVQVDVGTLVDMVVLSPFATRAFRELVPAVLRRYGYGKELTVRESSVGGVPIWI